MCKKFYDAVVQCKIDGNFKIELKKEMSKLEKNGQRTIRGKFMIGQIMSKEL